MVQFQADSQLSESEAMDLLIDLGIYSNIYDADRPRTVSAVAAYLARRGTSIPDAAAQMRLYREPPRFFFNLVGPTWHGTGVTVSRTDKSGNHRQILKGDGIYHTANYWAKFDQAFADFERAISDSNHELLLSAFSKGQAAVENYLNNILELRKSWHVETNLQRVWEAAPHHRGPWAAARQRPPWKLFLDLKEIRNDHEIHNKEDASGYTYEETRNHFNLFPVAIAGTLFELHKLTNKLCPASIIRASYFPTIRMNHTETGKTDFTSPP